MSNLQKIKVPRQPCVACRIAAFSVVVLIGLGLIWMSVIWLQRGAWADVSAYTRDIPKDAAALPAPAPCLQTSACCPCGATPLPAAGFLDGWPVLLLVTLGVLFTFIVVITAFALSALGLPVGALSQLGPMLQLFAQLLPHLHNFSMALRKTADALDAGKDATSLVATAVGGASTKVNDAASALDGLPIPWASWSLEQFAGPLYYVKKEDGDPPALFQAVISELRQTSTDLKTAGDKLSDLKIGLNDAAKSLRDAADIIDLV